MKLAELVQRIGGFCPIDAYDPEISEVQLDSRRVHVGDVFAALPGGKADGADYLIDAAARGAVAVLTPHELDLRTVNLDMAGLHVLQWTHPEARRGAARAAALVHGEPAKHLDLVGITGTNGKTTTAHLLGHLLRSQGRKPAVLGTAGHRLADGRLLPARHTTPDAPDLQRLLAEHRGLGGDSVVMEVSSHALMQERTEGLHFRTAVFTNLSREHLDYHRDMEEYAQAKARLFAGLGPDDTAVLNLDDPYWVHMGEVARAKGARIVTYSTRSRADLCASRLRTGPQGSRLEIVGMGIHSTGLLLPLRGRYNVENALAAAAAALSLGASPSAIVEGLVTAPAAPGRLECASPQGHPFQVYVDYAHSPDALERVLRALGGEIDGDQRKRSRQGSTKQAGKKAQPARGRGRLIVVFGCGGDRDHGKRPLMGRIAARMANVCWVTSDNPRAEDPGAILDEIVSGMHGKVDLHVELDRRRAIEGALREARPGDIVLVAGKGHESMQVIGEQILAFDDREVVREVLG
jgi:UDP-N-acetylmuramoyl-L-alanyl-D-glutamate--2,6-diaminopimelate ligase